MLADGMQNGKRYNDLDTVLKEQFGKKIAKLSLDAGMTCPTRDGTKGHRGCLFCSSRGSGDFTKPGSITRQMEQQSEIALRKWANCSFIAYFQSYTNTYAPVERLKVLFDEALSFPGVVGLAIATRCDCLSDEIVELMAQYNERTFLWLELGLQTSNDETGRIIRRGFDTKDFDGAVQRLHKRNIRTVVHLIAGLPGESKSDFLQSIRHINQLPVWGIKMHMLHVLQDSDLYEAYLKEPYVLPDMEDYAEWIGDALEILRPDITVHRLTGDGSRETLYAPLWTLDKRRVLTEINLELQRRKSYQGRRYMPEN